MARSSRRQFVRAAAAAPFAFTFVPSSVWGANERVNVACIGIGGKGASDVAGVHRAGGNIVALCDVDDGRRAKGKDARELHPRAKFFRDFRVMLDKEDKNIDAVTVSTPDHTHCPASVMAMRRGKHVYCQKPLTHSIGEARLMSATAAKHGVATQMGNQAHAGEPIRRAVELIRAGVIGKVSEVHCWTNRPIWPQGVKQRPEKQPVPDGLDWDLWLGPAPFREYNAAYVPFKWRGWWDFGTGALGDMGCHIMDMPFWSLDLNYPTSVVADAVGNTAESGPTSSTVTYRFPAGNYSHDLKFVWYDGDRRPAAGVLAGAGMEAAAVTKTFDLVMIGDKGKFFFNRFRTNWVTSPGELIEAVQDTPQTIPRVANEDAEWIAACQGGPAALSHFGHSGPFTEVVLLGNLAIRLGQKIEWNGKAMKAVNAPEAETLVRREYRQGWEM